MTEEEEKASKDAEIVANGILKNTIKAFKKKISKKKTENISVDQTFQRKGSRKLSFRRKKQHQPYDS